MVRRGGRDGEGEGDRDGDGRSDGEAGDGEDEEREEGGDEGAHRYFGSDLVRVFLWGMAEGEGLTVRMGALVGRWGIYVDLGFLG